MVICLERDADLHMAQLMPLPLTVSCFSKIQIGFTFLVPAYLSNPGKRAVKRVCVCVTLLCFLPYILGLREDGGVETAGARGRRRKLTDVRVYHDVAIVNPVCTPGGIQHRVRFDTSRLGHVRWRYSKRLIYGSLVCLSSDEFRTIRIASVAQRDPLHLQACCVTRCQFSHASVSVTVSGVISAEHWGV